MISPSLQTVKVSPASELSCAGWACPFSLKIDVNSLFPSTWGQQLYCLSRQTLVGGTQSLLGQKIPRTIDSYGDTPFLMRRQPVEWICVPMKVRLRNKDRERTNCECVSMQCLVHSVLGNVTFNKIVIKKQKNMLTVKWTCYFLLLSCYGFLVAHFFLK